MRTFLYLLPFVFFTSTFNYSVATNEAAADAVDVKACTQYAQKKKDEVTGREVIISKNKLKLTDIYTKRSFNLLISRQGFEMIFVFSTDDKSCLLKDTKVSLSFVDGDGMSFTSSNANNCNGQLNLSFGGIYGNLDDLMKVANSQLKEVSFVDKDQKEINLFMSNSQGVELKNTIDCVMSL